MTIPEPELRAVHDQASLYAFLRDSLHWPVDPEETFTYEGPPLPDAVAARATVCQIVPFTTDDPFTIMLAEFSTPFRRGDLRTILQEMRKEIRAQAKYGSRDLDEIIFICATENYAGIRFVRFEERSGRQPKMSVFGWDCDEPGGTRTLQEFNLPALVMPVQNLLGGPDWKTAHWAEAWNVEKVTKQFFKEYRLTFEAVEQLIAATNTGKTFDWRLFTQRLFNRLMFIQFLTKRGWLRYDGSTDYLATLLRRATESGENFYNDRLYWVFFYGLGSGEVGQAVHDIEVLRERRGDVPYLNGGLFEMVSDGPTAVESSDGRGAVVIPNTAFEQIIDGLFAKWNFTITESTPLDVEVAVDPEMLGKVFEELVTGRHESGSYYTPRGIVSFMCHEALKHYLESAGIEAAAAAKFVDERSTAEFRGNDFETVLSALQRVRVVDLACGSGAYLLGMLHELVDLRKLLFNQSQKDDAKDEYNRKLTIIQRNLYGVDLDEFAVNIARLRLWLSLAVGYTGTTPQPLPSLDFKIEQGDSITAPDPSNMGDIDIFRYDMIDECERMKDDHANSNYAGNRRELFTKIRQKCAEIAAWTHKGETVPGGAFDWRVEFGSVFRPAIAATDIGGALNLGGTLAPPTAPGGFDIVVANPPYVRQELIKDIKPLLRQTYPGVYNGTADLYCYFYARAVQLLKSGGTLAFITPSKWFRADYGANIRRYIAQQCRVHSITDFGDLRVFESATTYAMVFVAQKGQGLSSPCLTTVKSLDVPYPDVRALVERDAVKLETGAIDGARWSLIGGAAGNRSRRMSSAGVPLSQYVNKHVYFGIKTGLNDAFYIDGRLRDQLIAEDPASVEIIRPLAVGRDVKRWVVNFRDQWQIFTPIGVEMDRYPAVMRHLRKWQPELEKRSDKGDHFWELRSCAYYAEFDKPKIIYPQMMNEPQFAYDESGAITNQKCYIITNVDKYLLGVLNSAPIWQMITEGSPPLRGGYSEPRKDFILSLPIPNAGESDRAAIASLVQKCQDARGVGCEAWEDEINVRVAAVYGL